MFIPANFRKPGRLLSFSFCLNLCLLLLIGIPISVDARPASNETSKTDSPQTDNPQTDNQEELTRLFVSGSQALKANRYPEAEQTLLTALNKIPDQADAIWGLLICSKLAELYSAQNRLAQSAEYYEKSIRFAEKKGNRPLIASLTGILSMQLSQLREFDKAIEQIEKAIKIQEQAGNQKSLITSLYMAGTIYMRAGIAEQERGQYEPAKNHLQKALSIFSKPDTKSAPDVKRMLPLLLWQLGNNSKSLHEYDKAIDYAEQSVQIVQQAGGQGQLTAGLILITEICAESGQYSRATSVAQQLCDRARQAGDRKALAGYLLNLASTYEILGRYQEAISTCQQSLQIEEKLANSLGVVSSLYVLGEIYEAIGQYDRGLDSHLQALGKLERIDAPDARVTILLALAADYSGLGLYHKSLEHVALARAVPGIADDPQLLASIAGVEAMVCLHLKQYDRALQLYTGPEAKPSAFSTAFDSGNRTNNTGVIYMYLKQYDKAMEFEQKALAIEQKVGNRRYIANSLNNIGVIYQRMGDYDKAIDILRRAVEDYKESGNPRMTEGALYNLANTLAIQKRFHEAEECFTHALDMQRSLREQVFNFASELQMATFVENLPNTLDNFLALTLQQSPASPPQRAQAFYWTLQHKGGILTALLKFRQAQTLLQKDSSLEQLATRLRLERTRANSLGLNEAQRTLYQQEAEKTESALKLAFSRRYPASGIEKFDLSLLQKRLPPATALVEFVRYTPSAFKQSDTPLPSRYLVFVLTANQEAPDLIDLGDAATIDAAVSSARQPVMDYIALYRPRQQPARSQQVANETTFKVASKQLYQKVLAPVLPALRGIKTLLIAPDGALNRFPFEALTQDNDSYLIRDYRISYLISGRDLLPRPGNTVPTSAPVAFIAPDFDLAASTHLQLIKTRSTQTSVATNRTPVKSLTTDLEPGLEGGRILLGLLDSTDTFPPLSGLQSHVQTIGQLLSVQPLTGRNALEETLLKVRSPQVLHVLTHGFFVPGVSNQHRDAAAEESGGLMQRVPPVLSPMLRSGIAMAGANRWKEARQLDYKIADGWVTAAKMASMDLRGTELVTLAACETGLGDIRNGEGVYGLRRALLLAGAHSLLTSLWEVPGEETAVLTEKFYRHLHSGKSRSEALRSAQLDLMSHSATSHPLSWAGFVLVGDTGSLNLKHAK